MVIHRHWGGRRVSHAAHTSRHSSQFGVGLRALGPRGSSGDAEGSRSRWTPVTAVTCCVCRKDVHPVPRHGRQEGGAGHGCCPVWVGGGDPQDPLRVPAGRDYEEEQGGARALLPEDLPPVVGTSGPGEGGGQVRAGPPAGCVLPWPASCPACAPPPPPGSRAGRPVAAAAYARAPGGGQAAASPQGTRPWGGTAWGGWCRCGWAWCGRGTWRPLCPPLRLQRPAARRLGPTLGPPPVPAACRGPRRGPSGPWRGLLGLRSHLPVRPGPPPRAGRQGSWPRRQGRSPRSARAPGPPARGRRGPPLACQAGGPTGTAASASRRSLRSAKVSPAHPGETGEREPDRRWWRSSRWGEPSESDITVILVGMRGGRCVRSTTS